MLGYFANTEGEVLMPHDGMLMSVTNPSGSWGRILVDHHFLCRNFFQRKADFLLAAALLEARQSLHG